MTAPTTVMLVNKLVDVYITRAWIVPRSESQVTFPTSNVNLSWDE